MPNSKPLKPRRPIFKKTRKRSPYFPIPSKGLAQSSDRAVRRRATRGRESGVEGGAGDIDSAIIAKEKEEGESPGIFVGVVVVTEKRFLERMGDYRDGWMTEAESKRDNEGLRGRKKRRKRRRNRTNKRKKLNEGLREVKVEVESDISVAAGVPNWNGSHYPGEETKECIQGPTPGDFSRDAGFAVVIERRKSSPTSDEIKSEGPLDTERGGKEMRRRRRKRRKLEKEKVSISVEEIESPREGLRQSKKRKRDTALEIPITGLITPPSALSPETSLEISNTQPDEYYRRAREDLGTWANTVDKRMMEEDTLEARISQYWAKNYPSGIREKAGISTNKTLPLQLIKPKNGNGLQILDINTWPSSAGVSNQGTPKIRTITPHQATTKSFSSPNGDYFPVKIQKKETSTLPHQNLLQKIPPSSSTVNLYADTSDAVLPVSSPKTSVATSRKGSNRKIKKTGKISKYFASSAAEPLPLKKTARKKRVPAGTSIIPWPPLTADSFGLIQEELRNNSFHVIVSTIFLNKTRGSVAVPLLRQFLTDYPTPQVLSNGDYDTITNFLRPLGLHRTRAKRLIEMAKVWVTDPPTPGKGVKKYNYPARDTKPFNLPRLPSYLGAGERPKLGVEQGCEWEIAHLPGVGAYALDSWRIFCRDDFRKNMIDGDGKQVGEEEWRRVIPKDKELRACLRWRWAKEGLRWREIGDVEVEVEAEGR